jgi:cold shock protein
VPARGGAPLVTSARRLLSLMPNLLVCSPLCVKLPRRRNAGLLFYQMRQTPIRKKETAVAKGTVKWFNATKGYGFIQPTGGGKDVFVHISAVERAGLTTLNEGQVVEYEEASNRGKTSAENLKVQR